MTPAEELRAAAARLREESSGIPTSTWYEAGREVLTDTVDYPAPLTVAECHTARVATFIASMHPGFALAVADWLEASAARFERDVIWESPEGPCCAEPAACDGHEPGWYHADCDGFTVDDCHCFDKPLAVARAYLAGEGQ